jgi:hypothetical protein
MQHINTQAAEQCNSQLKKLRPLLAYMNWDNFSNHLVFTLWFYNLKKSWKAFPHQQSVKPYQQSFATLHVWGHYNNDSMLY